MSQPMDQTDALCSVTNVTKVDFKVPRKTSNAVSDNWAAYLFNATAWKFLEF